MLAERYEIRAEIGRGGMGVVYRGYDTRLGREVAIKFISNNDLGTEGRARLLIEAQAAAQLNHPNIVTIFDVMDVESPFIVMELVEGKPLRAIPIDTIDLAIAYTQQICTALQHAHSKGVIHRDLKPDNVIVLPDDSIKLMDFGLARIQNSPRISQSGGFMGTPTYIAPELLMGQPPSPQSDLYALGVMLFEMLTGKPPYSGADFISVLGQHLHADIPSPADFRSDIPRTLNDLVRQLLAKQPESRPASAAVVERMLTSIQLQQERDTVSPDSGHQVPGLEAKRKHVQSNWDGEWRRKGYLRSSLPVLDPVARELILTNQAAALQKGVQHLKKHRLLIITGMPGIGKSTLARALIEYMPPDAPPPFWHDFTRQQSSGNSLGVLLDRISSYLENCIGGSVRQDVMAFRHTPAGKPSAHDVDILIDHLTGELPLWLVFDNLETVLARGANGFTDPDLELLFDGLKSNAHSARIIITNPFVPILQDGNYMLEFGTRSLQLQGLDEESSVEYLRAYGLQDVQDESLHALARNAHGHPFTLNHIAHFVQSMGVTAAMESLQEGLGEITSHFRSSLEHRLSAEEFNALQSLSVLNREISLDGLCQTANTTPAVIKRLREEGLLLTNDSGKFWLHNIARSSLRSENAEIERPAHRNAANFYRHQKTQPIRRSIDDFADVLEWHYHAVQAGDAESAYESLFSTGLDKQLAKWNDYHLLEELGQAILALLPSASLGRRKEIRLHQEVGAATFYLGKYPLSIDHLQTALRLLEAQDDPKTRIELLVLLAYSHTKRGDFAGAMQICNQAFDMFSDGTEERLVARARHLRGNIHKRVGNLQEATADLEAALHSYDQLNDQLGIGNTTGDLGIVYYFQGDYTRAVENYRRAIASCQAQGNVLGVIIGHFNIGDFMIQDEQYEPAIHELRLALDLAHQQRILDVELDAGFYLVDAYTSLARYDEAELELERLRPTIGKDSTPRSLGLEQVATARLASKRADQEKALECFERGMEFLDAVQFKDDQCARAHLAYALFLNDNGRKPDARRVLQKGKLLFIELNNNLGLRSVERLEAQLA